MFFFVHVRYLFRDLIDAVPDIRSSSLITSDPNQKIELQICDRADKNPDPSLKIQIIQKIN